MVLNSHRRFLFPGNGHWVSQLMTLSPSIILRNILLVFLPDFHMARRNHIWVSSFSLSFSTCINQFSISFLMFFFSSRTGVMIFIISLLCLHLIWLKLVLRRIYWELLMSRFWYEISFFKTEKVRLRLDRNEWVGEAGW